MLSSKTKRELKIDQRQILIDSIEIGIPSTQQILTWGERLLPNGKKVGLVKNSKTVNYKRFTPFRDGLFCERIFGPVTSFVCACGKKQPHSKVTFCEKCEVEYIDQRSRRYRLGYISLLSPVTHIWYLKGRPSYLSLFLGKRKKTIVALAYCNAYLIEHGISKKTDTGHVWPSMTSLSNTENFLQKLEENKASNFVFSTVSHKSKRPCFPYKATYKSRSSLLPLAHRLNFCTLGSNPLSGSKPSAEKDSAYTCKATLCNNFAAAKVSENGVRMSTTSDLFLWKSRNGFTRSQSYQEKPFFRQETSVLKKAVGNVINNVPKNPQLNSWFTVGVQSVAKQSFAPSKVQMPLVFAEAKQRAKHLVKGLIQKIEEKNLCLYKSAFTVQPSCKTSYGTYFYARQHTLPFLPSLVSHFYLRDTLLNFTCSLPTYDDIPLVEYCYIKRWEPLRDVHKFMAHRSVDHFKNDRFSLAQSSKKNDLSEESALKKRVRGYKPSLQISHPFFTNNPRALRTESVPIQTNFVNSQTQSFTSATFITKPFAQQNAGFLGPHLRCGPSFCAPTVQNQNNSSLSRKSNFCGGYSLLPLLRFNLRSMQVETFDNFRSKPMLHGRCSFGLHWGNFGFKPQKVKLSSSKAMFCGRSLLCNQKNLLFLLKTSCNTKSWAAKTEKLRFLGFRQISQGFAKVQILAKSYKASHTITRTYKAPVCMRSFVQKFVCSFVSTCNSKYRFRKKKENYLQTGRRFTVNHALRSKQLASYKLLPFGLLSCKATLCNTSCFAFAKPRVKNHCNPKICTAVALCANRKFATAQTEGLHGSWLCQQGFATKACTHGLKKLLITSFCNSNTRGVEKVRFAREQQILERGEGTAFKSEINGKATKSLEKKRSLLSGLELTAIREILSYTGGGALQQLLQQFDQHDLCKFLFAEAQILRVLYETNLMAKTYGATALCNSSVSKVSQVAPKGSLLIAPTVHKKKEGSKSCGMSLQNVFLHKFLARRSFVSHICNLKVRKTFLKKTSRTCSFGLQKAYNLFCTNRSKRAKLFKQSNTDFVCPALRPLGPSTIDFAGAKLNKAELCLQRKKSPLERSGKPRNATKKLYLEGAKLRGMEATRSFGKNRGFGFSLLSKPLKNTGFLYRFALGFDPLKSVLNSFKAHTKRSFVRISPNSSSLLRGKVLNTWFCESNPKDVQEQNLALLGLETKGFAGFLSFLSPFVLLSQNKVIKAKTTLSEKKQDKIVFLQEKRRATLIPLGRRKKAKLSRCKCAPTMQPLCLQTKGLYRLTKKNIFSSYIFSWKKISTSKQSQIKNDAKLQKSYKSPLYSDTKVRLQSSENDRNFASEDLLFFRANQNEKDNLITEMVRKQNFVKDANLNTNHLTKRSFVSVNPRFCMLSTSSMKTEGLQRQKFIWTGSYKAPLCMRFKASQSEFKQIEESPSVWRNEKNLWRHELQENLRDDSQNKMSDLQKKQLVRISRRIYKVARRLKVVQLLTRNHRRPEWMILSHLPVLPPDLRPILQMSEKVIVASDLNIMYQRVIYRNNRHLRVRFIDFHLVTAIQRLVQDAVDRLIENGKGGSKPYYTQGGRPLKSLSDILKGKKGRFRLNLLGKRVDFSGRSVIVVSPSCQIHECGLPKDIALELYHYFLLRQLIVKRHCASIVTAKRLIKSKSSLMWDILRELMYHHPVLLNRAPTLHRLGIQAFQPKLILGNAILLHPLVCSGFNADFDGDQMGVHLPLSFTARAESWDLLWSRNNLLSPATGHPMLVPSQDMVLGFYYMTAQSLKSFNSTTLKEKGFDLHTKQSPVRTTYKAPICKNKNRSEPLRGKKGVRRDFIFIRSKETKTSLFLNRQEITTAFQNGNIKLHQPVWLCWNGKIENDEVSQKPLELRIHGFGVQQIIFEKQISSNFFIKSGVKVEKENKQKERKLWGVFKGQAKRNPAQLKKYSENLVLKDLRSKSLKDLTCSPLFCSSFFSAKKNNFPCGLNTFGEKEQNQEKTSKTRGQVASQPSKAFSNSIKNENSSKLMQSEVLYGANSALYADHLFTKHVFHFFSEKNKMSDTVKRLPISDHNAYKPSFLIFTKPQAYYVRTTAGRVLVNNLLKL